MPYDGLNALVTGGLGFIGSNLALELAARGASVTVVDSLLPGCGANRYNIAPAAGKIQVIEADIGDAHTFAGAIASADVIFNLAGEISHIHSMQFPERDLQVNTVAQLRFVLECARRRRGVRIVYAGTRQAYGRPKYLPIDESHPVQPVDFNGVHKYAANMYHVMLSQSGDLDAVVLRLTNVYGPRMALDASCQGFLSTYLRRLVLKKPVEIFGTGQQLRDPLYVDDAVEAFLRVGETPVLNHRLYNVGGPQALTLETMARTASRLAGVSEPTFRPFPPDRKPIDIGSYVTESRRFRSELGWVPSITFQEGMQRALDYYAAEVEHYLKPGDTDPPCRMPEHSGAPRRLTYSEI